MHYSPCPALSYTPAPCQPCALICLPCDSTFDPGCPLQGFLNGRNSRPQGGPSGPSSPSASADTPADFEASAGEPIVPGAYEGSVAGIPFSMLRDYSAEDLLGMSVQDLMDTFGISQACLNARPPPCIWEPPCSPLLPFLHR